MKYIYKNVPTYLHTYLLILKQAKHLSTVQLMRPYKSILLIRHSGNFHGTETIVTAKV